MIPETYRPIKYVDILDLRFSDLDPYGHVNSKHYIDFVNTARLNFMQKELQMPIETVMQKGIAFYLTKSSVNYRKAIEGLGKVLIESFVSDVKAQKVLVVAFEISSLDKSVLFSDGTLEFTLVDIREKRVTPAPEWLYPFLFSMPTTE